MEATNGINKKDLDYIVDSIKKYYQETKKISIDSTGYIILKEKYDNNKKVGPFFITRDHIGLVSFYLTVDEIDRIIECVETGDYSEPLNIEYSSSMGYEQLVELLTEAYNKQYNKRESLIQVSSLLDQLKRVKNDGTIFHVSSLYGNGLNTNKSKIKHVIDEQLGKYGFQINSVKFEEQVLIKFTDKNNEEYLQEEQSVFSSFPGLPMDEMMMMDSISENFSGQTEEIKEVEEEPIEEPDGYADLVEDLPSTKQVVAKLYTAEVANKTIEQLEREEKINNLKEKRLRSVLIAILCAYFAVIFAEVRDVDKKHYEMDGTFDSTITAVDEFINDMGIAGTGLSLASIALLGDSLKKHKELKYELKKKKKFDDQVISNLNDLDKKTD